MWLGPRLCLRRSTGDCCSADDNLTAPACQENGSTPQADDAAINSSGYSAADRQKTVAEKRMEKEKMKEIQIKRSGVELASPSTTPPPTNTGSSMSNSNVMGGSNRDDGRGSGDNARQPPGSGAATAAVSNASASTIFYPQVVAEAHISRSFIHQWHLTRFRIHRCLPSLCIIAANALISLCIASICISATDVPTFSCIAGGINGIVQCVFSFLHKERETMMQLPRRT